MSSEDARKVMKLSAPDGGWGYVIMLATTVSLTATVVPMAAFGIIFGEFLAQKGDDTTGATLVSSIYITVCFLMGIFTNILLKKYSFRKVGLLGSTIHFLGALGTIFVDSIGSLIFTYGIIKGIGLGLMLPTVFSSFNAYFDKKMMLMMSISQTTLALSYMVIPYVATWCLDKYGFRGTLLLLAGLNSFCFPASIALQPVKWHMKKEIVEEDQISDIAIQREQEEDSHHVVEPLLAENKDVVKCFNKHVLYQRGKACIVPGEMVSSIASEVNGVEKELKKESFWKSIVHSMDLHLLSDVKYMNMAIGLSLTFTADVAFYPIIPPIMSRIGFNSSEIALMISTFFTADLAARITLSVASAFLTLSSRMLVLISSLFSAALRIVLFLNDALYYKLIVLAGLGFFRCFIEIPLTVVISDSYQKNFESAYSVYMMVCGVVSLIIGFLMSYTKYITNSDLWACHLLTIACFITATSWTIEILLSRKKSKNNNNSNSKS